MVTPLRIANSQSVTVGWREAYETYELEQDGWLISPYRTVHPSLSDMITRHKGHLPFDYRCLHIGVATRRIVASNEVHPAVRQACRAWLNCMDQSAWVDDVLRDWTISYVEEEDERSFLNRLANALVM